MVADDGLRTRSDQREVHRSVSPCLPDLESRVSTVGWTRIRRALDRDLRTAAQRNGARTRTTRRRRALSSETDPSRSGTLLRLPARPAVFDDADRAVDLSQRVVA